MSEAMRYEKLLMKLRALEARVQRLEKAGGIQMSDGEALAVWEDYLIRIDVQSLTRTWRELETEDLYAACYGLSREAMAKLKQSMSANAWSMLVEELRTRHPHYLAHAARLRILDVVRQLQEMGEIVLASPSSPLTPVMVEMSGDEESRSAKWEETVLETVA